VSAVRLISGPGPGGCAGNFPKSFRAQNLRNI
jgi:hypothetical protein